MSDAEALFGKVKEELMECMARIWVERALSENLSVHNLEIVSDIGVNNVDEEYAYDSLFLGSDLDSLLSKTEKALESVQNLILKLKDITIKAGVCLLLDEDLAKIGNKNYMGANIQPHQKAFVILRHHGTKSLKTLARDDDSEFKVVLHTLVNGHGGNVRLKRLYFEYSTDWPLFLESLQRATEHSRIPPIDLLQLHHWPELEKTPLLTGGSNLLSGSISATDHPIQRNIGTRKDSGLGIEGAECLPAEGGYTLDHGPWLYQVLAEEGKGSRGLRKEGGFKPLNNALDFHTMVDTLREGRKQVPKQHREVVVAHSLDRAAQELWIDIQEMEKDAEDAFHLECKEAGMDEEDIGVPFLQHMAEQFKQERKQEMTSPEPGSSQGSSQ